LLLHQSLPLVHTLRYSNRNGCNGSLPGRASSIAHIDIIKLFVVVLRSLLALKSCAHVNSCDLRFDGSKSITDDDGLLG
jgi:hypothetical protein